MLGPFGFEDRAVIMDVVSDDAKNDFHRIELLTGPARRRRWSSEEKGRIVADTLQSGATVTEVARRWHVCPQQVWGWRREAREGLLALPDEVSGVAARADFVPIVRQPPTMPPAPEPSRPDSERAARSAPPSCIEIRLAGAVMRVVVGSDATLLTEVLRAVRASAA